MGRGHTAVDGRYSLKEKCGVLAAYSLSGYDVAPMLVRGLEALQHRGQESWGIRVRGHKTFKRMGLAVEGLSGRVLGWKGQSGIGHVRYSTKGRTILENAHPIDIGEDFSLAQNGTIANHENLFARMKGEFSLNHSVTDTKLLGLRLQQSLRGGDDWFTAMEKVSHELTGAYSLVFITNEGDIYAARDPQGFRPLSLGYHIPTSTHLVASESCAFASVDAKLIRDIRPGEIVKVSKEGLLSRLFAKRVQRAHCSFEYTYFAHPSSIIEGISVYEARKRVGRLLAQRVPLKGDVVIPVPDSARPAALGYSEESGIPMEEGLMKDRYRKRGTMRSFIEPSQGSRAEIVKQMIPITSTVVGKDVILVDDSVVRGTSSKIVVRVLRNAGAKSVKIVVTFPPVRHPCYMGIDFPTRQELVARGPIRGDKDLTEISKTVASRIDADQVVYNDSSNLSKGIGLPLTDLCHSCTTGNYSCLGTPTLNFKTRTQMKS